MICVPLNVQKIIETIEKGGFEGYIVGGCVRDLFLNKTPDDYDITTNALPNEIKSLFEKTVDTGIKHGTVTVIDENKTPFEITTYRTEDGYDDMRHPKNISFVRDIKEDLARRDFTVNALAFNEKSGLVDFFGGQNDLKNKILKAVGNPEKRFSEDALRILRLFRFSSTLGFKIERKTYTDALKLCKNLEKISSERVASELFKAVGGKNVNALKPLINKGGLNCFGISKCKNLNRINNLKNSENLRFFAFLELCECETDSVIKNLKLSNSIKNYCKNAQKILFLNKKSSNTEIKLALSLVETDIFFDVIEYKTVILGENLSKIGDSAKKIIKEAEPYKISHLSINGEDLKALGLKDKKIGEALEKLCAEVRKNPEINKKETLLNLINKE